MKILVIEDDRSVAKFIKLGLEEEQYEVVVSHDGADGLKRAIKGDFRFIILDWLLPKKDGLTVIRELRTAGVRTPVLMLSGNSTTDDIVTGLDAGADAYLTKPFSFDELQARVNSIIRRSVQDRGAEVRFADLRIDPVFRKVWRNDTPIPLTAREYSLLTYLVQNANTMISRADIAEHCWGRQFGKLTNVIDVYVTYLRKKVDARFPTRLIHTVRGMGYVLKESRMDA